MSQAESDKLPILYSFRRCPYAIRTRMALLYSGIAVELREIVLRDKPASMLEYSSKGTVPVLVLTDGEVIEESRDVINWSLSIHDPDQWKTEDLSNLIDENDFVFKQHLDQYKYADRHFDHPAEHYRDQCEFFLQKLETRLVKHDFLLGDRITDTDVSIFPFIRQFAFVDKTWFDQSPYPRLQKWLYNFLQSDMFQTVMRKYPPWQPENSVIRFPDP